MARQLKRQHSAEPLSPASNAPATSITTPPATEEAAASPAAATSTAPSTSLFGKTILPDDSLVGSPMKKQRPASFDPSSEEGKTLLGSSLADAPPPSAGNAQPAEAPQPQSNTSPPAQTPVKTEDEEL